jgi:hypothetical protein
VFPRVVAFGLAVLLAMPAARGRDEPKDDKKPPTAKDRYADLLKEFTGERQKLVAELQKLKGEEQQKLIAKYLGMGKDYAEKFYKLAEDNPTDPVAADALFWIVQNASGHKKAEDKVAALVTKMPLPELAAKLPAVRTAAPPVLEAVLKRAEADEKDPLAGTLLGWVASNPMVYPGSPAAPTVEKATDRLIEKYPDHAAVEQVCRVLSRGRTPESVATLKKIVDKTSSPRVKAEATLALGQNLASKLDGFDGTPEQAEKLTAEADGYLARAAELFGKENLAAKKESAEGDLKAFRTFRVGKEAPEISGKDLDGKAFKLSDYRGKVVLLDFWGNW